MALVTTTDLCKIKGVSRQAVSKAQHEGRLVAIRKGSRIYFDDEHELTIAYLNLDNRKRKKNGKKASKVHKAKRIEKEKKETQEKRERKQKAFEDLNKERVEAYRLKQKAELEKIAASTQKSQIDVAQKLKILIPKASVEKTFGEINSFVHNYLFSFGDRVSSDIAGICKISDSETIIAIKDRIDEEMTRCLTQLKESCKIKV